MERTVTGTATATAAARRELHGRAAAARELAELKRAERRTWATGDYGAIARAMFWDVGARIVADTGVGAGERVLDVACGTGNAALRAAAAGATATGLDLTPELLAEGRRLAAEAGLEVDWVAGDAEALPFADASFDVVLSIFGCMFAPRHELAARELARVLRPGGRLGVCSWTPRSAIADLMRTLFAHLPPAPGSGPPPPLWGDEAHVRSLLAGSDLVLACDLEDVAFRFASVEDALRLWEVAWGPFVEARALLEPMGRWSDVRRALADVLHRRNEARDGSLAFRGEYLVVVGRRAPGG